MGRMGILPIYGAFNEKRAKEKEEIERQEREAAQKVKYLNQN